MAERVVVQPEGPSAGFVVPLRLVGRSDIAAVGPKAANLGEASRAGFPVPPGVVVTTRAFVRFIHANRLDLGASPEDLERAVVPPDIVDEVRSAVADLGPTRLAVRSSGVEEDLPGASFAGQYETVLDVLGLDAVLNAVRRCWASAFAPRVQAYRRERGLTGIPRMAVLLQRLVPADAAGVAFTANPTTGARSEVVIEAVRGLGERLVSGMADADAWVVKDGQAVRVRETERVLQSDQAVAIAALARRVEHHFGSPQDIEWASDRGEIYLLQARPITALPAAVDWTSPAPGAWLRNLRLGEWLGEPVTPLFETWLVERLDENLWTHLHQVIHSPTPRPYHVVVNGYYYATANFLPKSRVGMVWFGVRYFVPGLILRPRRVAVIFPGRAYWGMQAYEREWRSSALPGYRASVQDAGSRLASAGPEEVLALVDRLVDAAGQCFVYVTALAGSAWKPEYVLAAFYRKHLRPVVGGSHLPLVLGLGAPSSASYAGAAPNLDWVHPTLGEFGSPADWDVPSDRRLQTEAARRQAEMECRTALSRSPRRLRRFERLLEHAQWAASLREEVVPQLTLGWPLMRRAVLRLGDYLKVLGVLDSADGVFFLTHAELTAAVRGRAPRDGYAPLVAERRAAWERERHLAPPLELGLLSPLARKMLGRFESTLGPRSRGSVGLHGVPASPGRATGPARVIRSAEEFGRFRKGDVLVAPATNPAWTPLFARAAAIVTDTGSLMAHASLVAREYGIPAVVGVGDATARLRDGEIVTVDGGSGSVEHA